MSNRRARQPRERPSRVTGQTICKTFVKSALQALSVKFSETQNGGSDSIAVQTLTSVLPRWRFTQSPIRRNCILACRDESEVLRAIRAKANKEVLSANHRSSFLCIYLAFGTLIAQNHDMRTNQKSADLSKQCFGTSRVANGALGRSVESCSVQSQRRRRVTACLGSKGMTQVRILFERLVFNTRRLASEIVDSCCRLQGRVEKRIRRLAFRKSANDHRYGRPYSISKIWPPRPEEVSSDDRTLSCT